MNKPIKQKKVVVYVSEDDYKALRIRLIEMGKTVSGWFRERVRDLIKQDL